MHVVGGDLGSEIVLLPLTNNQFVGDIFLATTNSLSQLCNLIFSEGFQAFPDGKQSFF